MAFHWYSGNKLERLAECFREELYLHPVSGVLTPETVVVQTQGMAAWLKLQLARNGGIAANLETPFLARFIHRILRDVFGAAFAASGDHFSDTMMRWRIYRLLRQEPEAYPELASYLGSDELKRWQLAARIAGLFDQYQIYRPDMLTGWCGGKVHPRYDWQRRLYLAMLGDEGHGRDYFLEKFLCLPQLPEGVALPARISVFGVGAMPPMFLYFFEKLAQFTEVHFFYLNPCREFWAYQYQRKDARWILEAGEAAEAGNPLLAALGMQGRSFFELAAGRLQGESGSATKSRELFEDFVDCTPFEPDSYRNWTMLQALQQDIFSMYNRDAEADGITAGHPLPCRDGDRSIGVHNCHSPLREVEVLHDQLLQLLQDGMLQARDIIVMAPDINVYEPYIHAVFGQGPLRDAYAVTDRSLHSSSRIAEAFTAILELPAGKLEASRLLALLDIPAVREQFRLSEDDLEAVRGWMEAAKIRWGEDGADRFHACQVAFEDFSWSQGIDRLLAGFAAGSAAEDSEAGGFAVDAAEGGAATQLGAFIHFARLIFAWRRKLDAPHPMAEWQDILEGIFEDFFAMTPDNCQELAALRRIPAQLAREAQSGGVTEALPLELLRDMLAQACEQSLPREAFLRGQITFCSLVPMRSIPLPVVAILGLSDGKFPRRDLHFGFNLIAADPRACDRSRQAEDRYLFLEAILSARRQLLLFYQGQSAKGDDVYPPAVPLGELLDYLLRAFPGFSEVRHKLQGFDFDYFDRNGADPRLFSYSRENFLASRALAAPKEIAARAVPEPVIAPEARTDLALDDLERFFTDPAAWFLRYRAGLNFYERDALLVEDVEPMEVSGGLERFLLTAEVGRLTLAELTYEQQYRFLRQSGRLPVGATGKRIFDAVYRTIRALPAPWPQRMKRSESLLVDVNCGNTRITGLIPGAPDGREQWFSSYSRFKWKYAVRMHLRHLVLTLQNNAEVATHGLTLTRDGIPEEHFIGGGSAAAARTSLEQLLAWFHAGQSRPLPILERSSFRYAQTDGDHARKLAAARTEYLHSEAPGTAPAETAAQRCFTAADFDRDAFAQEFAVLAELTIHPFVAGGAR